MPMSTATWDRYPFLWWVFGLFCILSVWLLTYMVNNRDKPLTARAAFLYWGAFGWFALGLWALTAGNLFFLMYFLFAIISMVRGTIAAARADVEHEEGDVWWQRKSRRESSTWKAS